MTVTLIVEPMPGGHRFQAVAHVAALTNQGGPTVLLTCPESAESDAFEEHLDGVDIEVLPRLSSPTATAREIATVVAAVRQERQIDTVVVLDADQLLKWWWLEGRRALGPRRGRPRVVFMLTRYPARLRLTDRTGWRLRLSKGLLALVAVITGVLDRVSGFAGREDLAPGWLVKRARDPAVCSAHSRDRASIREELGLPADELLVGICGGVSERKFPDMVLAAIEQCGKPATLVLAGGLSPGIRAWVDGLGPEHRVIDRDGFLSNATLDQYVAAMDVIALVMTNNGPSGIMGKALAAGVPVVTAGSVVRARELAATHAGEAADFDVPAIAAALGRVFDGRTYLDQDGIPPATAEAFARTVMGQV